MKKNGLISLLMSVMLILSMLPSAVFAGELTELGGELKISGEVKVGSVLRADYEQVQPSGMSDDQVSFLWERKISDEEKTELSKEKTYTPVEEDTGYCLILTVTGLESMGYTGSLKVETTEVAAADSDEESGADAAQEAQDSVEELMDVYNDPEPAGEPEYTEEGSGYAEDAGYYEDELMYAEEPPVQDTPAAPAEEEYVEEPSSDEYVIIDEEIDEGEELRALTEEELAELNADDSGEIIEDSGEDWDSGEDFTEGDDWNVEEEIYVNGTLQGDEEAGEDPYADEEVPTEEDLEDETPAYPVTCSPVTLNAEEGFDPGSVVQEAKLVNTGAEAITLLAVSSEHFTIPELAETKTLEAGGELIIHVSPRTDVTFETGEPYEESITLRSDSQGEVGLISVKFTVSAKEEQPSEILVSFPEKPLDFGTVEELYAPVDAQVLTILNNGSEPVTLMKPQEEEYAGYMLEWPSGNENENVVLESGMSAEIGIWPTDGLTAGNYDKTLVIRTDKEGVEVSAELKFTVAVQPVYSLGVSPEEPLDFGVAEENYDIEPQTVTITNTGNQPLVLNKPGDGEYADYRLVWPSDTETEELQPGQAVELQISPADGLGAGNYDDTIVITSDAEGVEAVIEVLFTVEEEPVYGLSCDPETLKTWSAEEGYKDLKNRKAVLTNEGNQTLHLIAPSPKRFNVEMSVTELAPGESAEVLISPKNGCTPGSYGGDITFRTEEGAAAVVAVSFEVTEKVLKITGIVQAAPITGIANSAEKSSKGLKLPSTVKISTTNGNMDANVEWNAKGSSYEPSRTEAQTFTVEGQITLPKGVKNPDNISLKTSVQVTVDAYVPKLASADNNQITGMTGVYAPRAKITFTAVGAGMDNSSPRKGDTRYLPLSYTVSNTTKTWKGAPYGDSFGMAYVGDYTLSVEFEQEQYDGASWVKTGVKDTKTKGFKIAESNITVTPTASPLDANHKNPAQTGDDTTILPFIIALILAAACVVGVVVYRKRK